MLLGLQLGANYTGVILTNKTVSDFYRIALL